MSTPAKWKIGMPGPGGDAVSHIHGYAEGVMVYENGAGVVRYWLDADETTPLQRRAISRHTHLESMVKDLFLGETLETLKDDLGAALFSSLCSNSVAEHDEAFKPIEERVRGKAIVPYVSGAVLAAIIITVVCVSAYSWFPQPEARPYFLYLAMGSLGALTSVFNQLKLLNPGATFEVRSVFLLGAVRVILGLLLAVFFIVAAKAELLLGFVTRNSWAFMAFSFLSGFSERWAVDQLDRLGSSKRKI